MRVTESLVLTIAVVIVGSAALAALGAGSVLLWRRLLRAIGHRVEAIRRAARELERDTAAEIALSIQPPRIVTEIERQRMFELQQRIARAIRGQGAHVRDEVLNG